LAHGINREHEPARPVRRSTRNPDPPVQLPAIIPPGAVAVAANAELRLVPALITAAGDAAGWRYVEFFTANIRNPQHAARLCAGVRPVLRGATAAG
jgi:hypothetical protein